MAYSLKKEKAGSYPSKDASCFIPTAIGHPMAKRKTMITLKVNEYKNFSPSMYNELIANLQFHRLTCPKCSHSACLSIHGYYCRHLRIPTGKATFRICRLRCENCRCTHAVLPSAIVPYSQIPLADQIEAVKVYESEEKTAVLLRSNTTLDESRLRYVIRQYLKCWKQRLIAHHIKLLPEGKLTDACFSHYSRQFMQIRTTSNILLCTTT